MKKLLLAMLLAVSVLMLSACASTEDSTPVPEPVAEARSVVETETPEETPVPVSTPEPSIEAEPESTIETEPVEDPGTIHGGADMSNAEEIQVEALLHGTRQGVDEAWFAFTTGEITNEPYAVTVLNQTSNSCKLCFELHDKDGNRIGNTMEAGTNGQAVSLEQNLQPKTTYYVKMYLTDSKTADYLLYVRDFSVQHTGTILGTGDAVTADAENITGASNQGVAPLLALGKKYESTLDRRGSYWFAFETGDSSNDSYAVTLVNRTPNACNLCFGVYNQYGNRVGDSMTVGTNGQAVTLQNNLSPNCVYYLDVWLEDGGSVDATICLKNMNDSSTGVILGTDEEIRAGDAKVKGASNQCDAPVVSLGTNYSCSTDAGGVYWFAFRTGDTTNEPYVLSVVNQTVNSCELSYELIDQYGKKIADQRAGTDGQVSTISQNLSENSIYYLKVYPKDRYTIDYQVSITNKDFAPTATDSSTSGNSPAEGEGATENTEGTREASKVTGGTNQADATLLPLNTRVYGQTTNSRATWFSFTTTSTPDTTYRITVINKTVGSSDIRFQILNMYGDNITPGIVTGSSYAEAENGGRASTISIELAINTTYYIKLYPRENDTIDYAMKITDGTVNTSAYQTADNIQEAKGATDESIAQATNMDDAQLVPIAQTLTDTIRSGQVIWYAFTTADITNDPYLLTVINKTVGSCDLRFRIINQYGDNRTPGIVTDSAYAGAESDGAASTISVTLSPNCTYYIQLWLKDNNNIVDYNLVLNGPTNEEEKLVFDVPFELNSTQVLFVANSDQFIDEAAAIAALEPVAEVILAHPDHPILLAGTTAQDGSPQDACERLSNKRAAAVKNLLVSHFKVPESQLLTVGLGFEKDPFVRGKDYVNGNCIESEAVKNRRVVVMDAEDPIAKQLLGS